MEPTPEIRIGERLRFYRLAKGKTQVVVAGLAGVSREYLSLIERGEKTPTIGLLQQLAKVLDVRVSDLLGEQAPEHSEAVPPAGIVLQRALISHDAGVAGPVDLAGLRARVNSAWGIWQGVPRRFSGESGVLPELIGDVQAAVRVLDASGPAEERRAGYQVAADLYFLLRSYAKRIGRTDLALLVADRGVLMAQAAGDPVRLAAAKWNLGHVLLAQGESAGADGVALGGALWLVSAVAATRNGRAWEARERIANQALPAARLAGEGNVMWTVFGPTNVALHAMSLEMETGEAVQALRIADDIDTSDLPSLERRTTFALEVARCYEQRRDEMGVLVHLTSAESTGPEDMKYNVMARELVGGLLRRARGSMAQTQAQALAERVGLLA
jgi:transcriptional regulator with XRE-family HTH domain